MADRSDAIGLATRIRDGELSPAEAVEEATRRIEQQNPSLGAVVHTRFDEARDEVARGLPDGPLRGVPTLVKDLGMDVAGMPSTRGSRLFRDVVAMHDSELVARYRRAGMVVLGTTNTPELGKNASTEPLLHGPTRNPWRPTHSPGGSSGGSAAAVAAGMVAVAHGNDGGGSIRIPAAMCGLFGLKPSRGRVPTAPYASALASPLGVNHALTTTVRDSAVLLDIAAGPVAGDPIAEPARSGSFAEEVGRDPGRLRIAYTTSTGDGRPADPQCAAAAERAAACCVELGHEVVEAKPVYDAAAATRAAGVLMRADLVTTVDRRLGELGRELERDDLEPFTHAMLERARSLTATTIVEALEFAQTAAWELARSLSGYDVLITPTLAKPVPPLGTLDTTNVTSMFEQGAAYSAFTGIFNLTGQPAMSVPFGLDTSGLPLGVQFVAALGADGLLLRLAAQLEQAAPWPVPAVTPAAAERRTS